MLIAIPDGSQKEQPTSTAANKVSTKCLLVVVPCCYSFFVQAKGAKTAAPAASSGCDSLALYNALEAQGKLVRDLKAKDAKSVNTYYSAAICNIKKEYETYLQKNNYFEGFLRGLYARDLPKTLRFLNHDC